MKSQTYRNSKDVTQENVQIRKKLSDAVWPLFIDFIAKDPS